MVLHEAEELETAGFNLRIIYFYYDFRRFFQAEKGVWRNSSCLLLGALVSPELL